MHKNLSVSQPLVLRQRHNGMGHGSHILYSYIWLVDPLFANDLASRAVRGSQEGGPYKSNELIVPPEVVS